mmetsp:Transcript_48973/g.106635  ORF Transcript_48973/g.106635 Transcript_48973/m.106635 type:complete len:483 (+) Transcript_48973:33-1481(+)
MIAWLPGAGSAGDFRAAEFQDCMSDSCSAPEVVDEPEQPNFARWCAPRAECRTGERTLRTPSDSGNSWSRVVCRSQPAESSGVRGIGGAAGSSRDSVRAAVMPHISDQLSMGAGSRASVGEFAVCQQPRFGFGPTLPGQFPGERSSSSSCDRHTVASHLTSEPGDDDDLSECPAATSSLSSAKDPSAAVTQSDTSHSLVGGGLSGSGPGEFESLASRQREFAFTQQQSATRRDVGALVANGCKPSVCGISETVPSTNTPGGLVLEVEAEVRLSVSARGSGCRPAWSSGTVFRRSASAGSDLQQSRRSGSTSEWSARPSSHLSSRLSSVLLTARRRQTAADMPDEESGADTLQSSSIGELPAGSPAPRGCFRAFPGSDESSCFDSQDSSFVGEGQLSPGLPMGGERWLGSRRTILIDWDDGGDDCAYAPCGAGIPKVSGGLSMERSPTTWVCSTGACPSPVVIDVNQSSGLCAAVGRLVLDVS